MSMFIRRYGLPVVFVLVAATGCLRSAGGGELPAPQSQPRGTDTPLPSATPTDTPVAPTNTPGSEAVELPTQEEAVPPTSEPLEAQILPTETEAAPQEAVGGPVAQEPTPTLSELLQQATEIIATATQRALDQTATAEGPQVSLPTFTPTPDPFQQPATATPGQVLSGADCIHEVARGENLYRLSLRYGLTVHDIAQASGVTNVDVIAAGQKLTIPGCGTTGAVPPPTSIPAPGTGDTGAADGAGTGTVGAGGITHVVRQGETLFELSLQYNVPVADIAAANGISNINLIYIGQELTIP